MCGFPENPVILSETDTAIGFLSQNPSSLDRVKQRAEGMRYITALPSLRALNGRCRVPLVHRKRVRRERGTTFIFPCGDSYRVISDDRHLLLIKRFGWMFTTSANLTGEPYDRDYAISVADIVIHPVERNSSPSTIYRLGRRRVRRLR
jgi:tRNA A37 threonylcarbamoyladenosine synthetase subunit TsaC/SUA5/YrdC